MPFGLTDDALQQICQVFEQFPAITEAFMYGSRAKGNFAAGSDLDITLKGEGMTYNMLLDLETRLEELLLPYKMDLSLYHLIDNPKLIEHIDRVGIAFYNRKNKDI